jgi:RNA polymerase sigma-70 factor (ECF subfamily)
MARRSQEPPDEVLVVAAILGNLGAFDELVLRYRAAVVRAAQGIVGYDHAEDVAQDALLLAYKALPSIEEPARFAAWLAAITRNRALRYGKRERQRQTGRIALDEFLLEQIESLSTPLVGGSSDEEVRMALENIPVDYALVLKLKFLDEMPLKRIAAFLGVPVTTVKWRVHRGKQLLRDQIQLLRQRGETWKEIGKSES